MTTTDDRAHDTGVRALLADPEAVFMVSLFGVFGIYGGLIFEKMQWFKRLPGVDGEAVLTDVEHYLTANAGHTNPLAQWYFAGGAIALAVLVGLGIALSWVPLPTAAPARIVAIAGACVGVVWTLGALVLDSTQSRGDWLASAAQAPWLTIGGFVLLGAAAAMTRPAVRPER